jgi:uncharacterized protein (DUF1778 family)
MNQILLERSRITARVSVAAQQTLETAAGMVGATLNQFIVQSALREAERVIEQERVIALSAQNAIAFLAAIDNPPSPNKALRQALANHEKRRHDQAGTFSWTPQQKSI